MDNGRQTEQVEKAESYDLRVLRALRRIMRAVTIYSHKLAKDHKITSPQLLCLAQIVQEGSSTLSALCKEVHMSPSTVCGILDRLRAKGLIHGERSARDRRKVEISATEAGVELVTHAPSLLQDGLAGSLAALPVGEQMMITGALERIVEMMEIEHIDVAPLLAMEPEPDHDEQERTQ